MKFSLNLMIMRSEVIMKSEDTIPVVLVSLASKYDKFYYIIIFFVAIEFFPLPRLKDQ